MLLKMLQHVFKRKYSTPSSSSSAHIITKPDSSNKSPSESGRFTAKCNRIPLLFSTHYHMSPTYTWSTKCERMVSIVVWSHYYRQASILSYCLHTVYMCVMIFSLFTQIIWRKKWIIIYFAINISPPGSRCAARQMSPVSKICSIWKAWREVVVHLTDREMKSDFPEFYFT